MIGNAIAAILLLILIFIGVKDWKNGAVFYIIFSMISPHIHLSDVILSFEIVSFFPFIGILLIKNRKIFTLYSKWKHRQLLWIYVLLVFISSLLSMISNSVNFPFIALFGHVRVVFIIYVLQALYEKDPSSQIDKIITPVLFINTLVAIVQLLIPNSVELFYDFYYKASLTPLKEVLRIGYFNRAYGTFGTPVSLGVFSLFSFAMYLGFYFEKRPVKLLVIKLLLSAIIGVMALSKTAIIGIPVMLILGFVLSLTGVIRLNNKKIFVIPFILTGVGYILTRILMKLNLTIVHYLRFLYKPFDALSSRYNTDSGILTGTYEVISENLIFGVGPNEVNGAFLGDSMYIVVLYTTGILGILVYFGIIASAMINVIRKRRTIAIFSGVAFLLAGLAAPVHINKISAVFIAYLFSNAEIRKITRVNEADQ